VLCVVEEGGKEGGRVVLVCVDVAVECYPSWYCGQGKNGDPAYWER